MLDNQHPILSFFGIVYICNTIVVLASMACKQFKCKLDIDTTKKEEKKEVKES